MSKPQIRTKYATRTIRLIGEQQRDLAIALLNNVPLDSDRPLECLVREEVTGRSLDANGYYWLRLTEIADQAWFNRKQFNKDTWHIYAGKHLMPNEITTKDGVMRSKWVECPDGSEAVISTTLLERKCFADYTTAVEAFGSGLGVLFSENPRVAR